jgi:prepilin-type N-terminal cleavage/methylation domain-containing protein
MQEERKEQGFTLIELLVAIVVVGILTAVAIVGIGGLTNKGNNAACSTSVDAARAASAVVYANTGSYPSTFTAMTGGTNPALTLQGGVTATATTMSNGSNWSVTIGGGGANPTTFTACPT